MEGCEPPAVVQRATVQNGTAVVDLNLIAGFDWPAVPAGGLKGSLRVRGCRGPTPQLVPGDHQEGAVPPQGGRRVQPRHDRRGGGPRRERRSPRHPPALLSTAEPVRVSGEVGKATDTFGLEGKVAGKKSEVKLELANTNPVLVPGGKDGDVEVRVRKAEQNRVYTGRFTSGPSRPGRGTERPRLRSGCWSTSQHRSRRGPRRFHASTRGGRNHDVPLQVVVKGPAGGGAESRKRDAFQAPPPVGALPTRLTSSRCGTRLSRNSGTTGLT